MAEQLKEYDSSYEWVRVKALQRFNISKRPWSNGQNIGLDKGETYVLPRDGEGMGFYFDNDGFLKVVDENPDVSSITSSEVGCTECERTFSSEKGMKQHRRQKHENNKNEDEGE